jgi:hypothetical protein
MAVITPRSPRGAIHRCSWPKPRRMDGTSSARRREAWRRPCSAHPPGRGRSEGLTSDGLRQTSGGGVEFEVTTAVGRRRSPQMRAGGARRRTPAPCGFGGGAPVDQSAWIDRRALAVWGCGMRRPDVVWLDWRRLPRRHQVPERNAQLSSSGQPRAHRRSESRRRWHPCPDDYAAARFSRPPD